jgi:hypothetical protein
MHRNYMLMFHALPRHRNERVAIAVDADEDFTMRRELDVFIKATERWHLTPAERRTLKMLAPFFGRTPLALLFRDMSGFKAVAEYLAAWQGTKN